MDIKTLLKTAVEQNASDIHCVVNQHPYFRLHGELQPITSLPVLSADTLQRLALSMLTEEQRKFFEEKRDIDFSYSLGDGNQFRVNLHFEKGNWGLTIRVMPNRVTTFEELGLPPVIKEIVTRRKGLVIVSGPAGSGKSTTLRCMIDEVNKTRKGKIVTIEDPIEFIHKSKNCLVIQREVGSDTLDFATALKYALRQDPDLVVIGEIRDVESISMALTTAETGHLVFTTVHAPDTVETINRIIDVYPPGHREQVWSQLSGTLVAVISQVLIPRKDTPQRILATEVMLGNLPVRNLIRQGAMAELRGQLRSDSEVGMHTMEQCLSQFVQKNFISVETAKEYARYPEMLKFSERHAGKMGGAETQKPEESADFKKTRKILIVSPDPANSNELTLHLRNQGFVDINTTKETIETFDKICDAKAHVVIFTLNSTLEINCFELCQQYKRQQGPKAKVIIIAKSLKPEDMADAKRVGADAFLLKTSNMEFFNQTLARIFSESAY